MPHSLSQRSKRQNVIKVSKFCTSKHHVWGPIAFPHSASQIPIPSAHCKKATWSFLKGTMFHIAYGLLQGRASTWWEENVLVKKQCHRNIYCSYSPWQQIIMLEIRERRSYGFSVGDPNDSKKYDQILVFKSFVHFAIIVPKTALKPSAMQSMLLDVPQDCSRCPYLFIAY